MASTSTGFAPNGMYREQYSSGGQLVGFSSLTRVRVDAGSTLDIKGVQTYSSGSVVLNENIKKSTAASTGFSRTGLTVIATSLPQQLSVPVKGRVMDLLFLPTTGKAAKVKTGSTAIFINSSNGKDFVISVTLATSKASNHGMPVRLIGGSTKQWWASISQGSTVRFTVSLGATT